MYVETLRNICLKGTILFIKMKVTINLSTNKVGALFSQKPNININCKPNKNIGVHKKRKESYWSI